VVWPNSASDAQPLVRAGGLWRRLNSAVRLAADHGEGHAGSRSPQSRTRDSLSECRSVPKVRGKHGSKDTGIRFLVGLLLVLLVAGTGISFSQSPPP
jgi:hypothetical protein